MAYQPGSFGDSTVDPLTYAPSQGDLRPGLTPRVLTPAVAPPPSPPAPAATPSLLDRGISAVRDVFTDPQPGDPDYSQPLREQRPPVTDLDNRSLSREEVGILAGTPGVLQTFGEELGTRRGLIQKIPVFGQLPDATRAIRAWQAVRRMKKDEYLTDEDEADDLRSITRYFNETRVQQKRDENRSFMGKAISYPLRSIPFIGEIMLSNAISRRWGMKSKTLTDMGIASTRRATMSGTRRGIIRFLNKFIGENGEKMIADRMKAYAEHHGGLAVKNALGVGGKNLMKTWIKEARGGLAKNILARNPGVGMVGRQLGFVETDVAQKLIERNVALRLSSRALEVAAHMPIVASGRLLAAGPSRQLSRGGFVQAEDGTITFNDTGESMLESTLKGMTSEYLEFLSEYSGGEIQNVLKKGVLRHLTSLKLAELAAKLPGGLRAVNRVRKIMKSGMVTRGMRVYGRFMDKAAHQALYFGPLEEYGEEVVNMVGQSVLNLNDDGTPWATRVVKSLLHPVFQPREALTMLVGFSLVPAGAFAVGSVSGRLSDEEVAANKEWRDKLVGEPNGDRILFQNAAQPRALATQLLGDLREEARLGQDSSWAGRLLSKAFPSTDFVRPGSKLDLLMSTGVRGGKTAQELRDLLINAPEKLSTDFLTQALMVRSEITLSNSMAGKNPENRAAFQAITGITQRFADMLTTLRRIDPMGVFATAPVTETLRVKRTAQEIKASEIPGLPGSGLATRTLVGHLSIPRMETKLREAEELLGRKDLKMSVEDRQELTARTADWKSTIAQFKGGSFLDVARPYLRIISHDPTADEAEDTGAFAAKQRILPGQVDAPEKHEHIRMLAERGNLKDMSKLLKSLSKELDVYYVPGAGFEMSDEEWADYGYGYSKEGRRVTYAMWGSARKGERTRMYVTNDTRAGDLLHEVAHMKEAQAQTMRKADDRKAASPVQAVAEALLKLGVSERTLAGKTLPEPLRGYLQSLIPKAAKGKVQLSLKNYLLAVSEGELPAPRFEEDAANLLMMYMDYSDELIAIRKEARGAQYMQAFLQEGAEDKPSRWLRFGLERIIQSDPFLKAARKKPMSPKEWKDLQASVQQVPVKPVQVEKKPEVKPAAKPEVKLVAKPEVKPEVKLAAKPEVKSAVKPEVKPAVKPEAKPEAKPEVKPAVKPEVKPAAKPEDNKKRRDTPMPLDDAPLDTDQKLSASVEDTPLVEAERNITGMARILNLMNRLTRAGEPAENQLFRETAAGEIDWNYLEDQLQALGIKGTLMTGPRRIAYNTLKREHADLFKSILRDPAYIWKAKLLDKVKAKATFVDDLLAKGLSPEEAEASWGVEHREEDTSDDPDAAPMGEAELFSENRMVESLTKRSDVRRWMGNLNLSYGVEAMASQIGERTFLGIYLELAEGRRLMEDLFLTAMSSEQEFKEAVTNPEAFLEKVAADSKVSDKFKNFWLKHLAPTLRQFTYDEMENPNQEVSLGSALTSVSLRLAMGYSIDAKGRVRLDPLNLSKDVVRKVTRLGMQRARGIFNYKGPISSKQMWDKFAVKLLAKSPRFKGKYWSAFYKAMKSPKKGDLLEGLKVLEDFFPKPTAELGLGITFDDLAALLDDPFTREQVRVGLQNFAFWFGENAWDRTDAQRAYVNIQTAIKGAQGQFGVISTIYAPALATKYQNLDTSIKAYGEKPAEARTGTRLKSILNTGANVATLSDLNMIYGDNVTLRSLTHARRVTVQADGKTRTLVTKVQSWTQEDRELLLDTLLRRGTESQSEKPGFWFPLAPYGKKAALNLIHAPFFKAATVLAKTYTAAYAWLQENGGVDHVQTPEMFRQQYGNTEDPRAIESGNLTLYAAVLHRMIFGVYTDYVDKKGLGFFNLGKRSEVLGDGAQKYPTETGVGPNIGVFRIASIPVSVNPTKSVPLMDGQWLLTERGAKDFRVTDKASLKGVLNYVTKKFSRIVIKGNAVLLNSETMKNIDPQLQVMLDWVNAYNEKNPNKPIHFISVQDNSKTFSPDLAAPASVLTRNVEGALQFNKKTATATAVDYLPTSAFATVANLRTSTKPAMMTVSAQMMDSQNLRDKDVVDDILFAVSRELWGALPTLRGTTKEAVPGMERFLRPDEDAVLSEFWAGDVDIRMLPQFVRRLSLSVSSRIARIGKSLMLAVRNQSVDNTLAPEVQPLPPRYTDDQGNLLEGEDLRLMPPDKVHAATADLYANIDGGRYEAPDVAPSLTGNAEEDVLTYLWNNRQTWSDLFESTLVRNADGSAQWIQLERKLLVDVVQRLDIKPGKTEHRFTLPGEYAISTRTPNSGTESTTLFRLKDRVGKGTETNWNIAHGRVAAYAGEDFDGDWRFTYLVARGENGLPKGHAMDLVTPEDRIVITPPGTVKWNGITGASLAFQVLARGIMHPGESDRYFAPAKLINPLERSLEVEHYGDAADAGQRAILDNAEKLGWNDASNYRAMLGMPGDMQALGVSVRIRTTLAFILQAKLQLRKGEPVRFRIPGIESDFTFLGAGGFNAFQENLIRRHSGDVVGMIADVLKDYYAVSLNMKTDYLGLMFSAVLSNPHLRSMDKGTQKPGESREAFLLKSVVGTIELLQTTLFSPAMVKRLRRSGFLGNKVSRDTSSLYGETLDPGNLWVDPNTGGLVRLAHSLRRIGGIFDLYRRFKLENANRFREGFSETELGGTKNLSPTFLFDSEDILNTAAGKQSQAAVDNFDRVMFQQPKSLEGITENKETATQMANNLLEQNPALKKSYKSILTQRLWEENNIWVQEILAPAKLEDLRNHFNRRSETGGETLAPAVKGKVAPLQGDRAKGAPVVESLYPGLSDVAVGRSYTPDLAAAWDRLPVDMQHALVIHAVEFWGLDAQMAWGSYASLLPPKAMKWFLSEAAKFDSEIKTALGEQEAAALPSQTGIPAAERVKTPSAVSSVAPVAKAPVAEEQVEGMDEQEFRNAERLLIPATDYQGQLETRTLKTPRQGNIESGFTGETSLARLTQLQETLRGNKPAFLIWARYTNFDLFRKIAKKHGLIEVLAEPQKWEPFLPAPDDENIYWSQAVIFVRPKNILIGRKIAALHGPKYPSQLTDAGAYPENYPEDMPRGEYHTEVGRLLGYSEKEIKAYVESEKATYSPPSAVSSVAPVAKAPVAEAQVQDVQVTDVPDADIERITGKPVNQSVAEEKAVSQSFKEQADENGVTWTQEDLPPATKGGAAKLHMSMGEQEMTYKLAENLDPVNSLHQEMRKRFNFMERMVGLARIELGHFRRMSGIGKHDIAIREAVSMFLNNLTTDKDGNWVTKAAYAAHIRLASNIHEDVTLERGNLKHEFGDTAQTVAQVVAKYEALRKQKPELKLASFEELVKLGRPILVKARTDLNRHAYEFSDSRELFADVTKRTGVAYVPNETVSAFDTPQNIAALVRVKLNEWYAERHPGEVFTLRIHPLGAKELVTLGKIPAGEASLRSHRLLMDMSPEERKVEIDRMARQLEQDWATRDSTRLRESSRRGEQRESTIDKQFEDYGRILRNPDYAEAAEEYIKSQSDFVSAKRYLSYMANLTDGYGIPSAFFLGALEEEGKAAQKLLSPTVLRNMFDNWKISLETDGITVAPYDVAKNIWDNLAALENLAVSHKWFEQRDYERVDLGKKTKGFTHAWVLEGPTRKLLDHVTSRGIEDLKDTGFHGVLKRTMKGVTWFNLFTKQLALTISFFHAGTLIESHVSAYGINKRNPLLNPVKFFQEIQKVWQTSKNIMSDPAQRQVVAEWMNHGLTFRFSAREPTVMDPRDEGGPLDKFLADGIAATQKNPLLKNTFGRGLQVAQWTKHFSDHLLWEVLQPASKLITANRMYADVEANPDYDHLMVTKNGRDTVRREIAQVVNQAFGGLEWREMIWATPMARDVMRALIFAPDWTMANLQLAMVPDMIQRTLGIRIPITPVTQTDIRSRQLLEKNWPAFIYLVLMAVPAMWQFGIYSAFGDPDDEPFMWMNEKGKETSIDTTPLFRKLGRKFGITEKRRSYLRWGKSGYEIGGWFGNPWKTALGKSSMGVKVAWEQLTGRNTAGWDMPWTREEDSVPLGGVFMVNGSLMESRMGYVAQKFMPMTILNMLKGDRPPTFFAPASLGMSSYAAERQIADVLQAYADESLWYQIKGKPEQVKRLETLVDSTLEAAWRNGYEVKKVLSAAKGMAGSRQTAEFFAILEKDPKAPNLAKLEKVARSAQRINRMYRTIYTAIKNRYAKRRRRMTPAQQEALRESWQLAREKRGEI